MFVRNVYTANGAIAEKEGLIVVVSPAEDSVALTLAAPSACDDGRVLSIYFVDSGDETLVTVTTANGSYGYAGGNPWTVATFIGSSGGSSFPNTGATISLLAHNGHWSAFQSPTSSALSIS